MKCLPVDRCFVAYPRPLRSLTFLTIYVNDISNALNSVNFNIFADDLQVCCSADVYKFGWCLALNQVVSNWANDISLLLNDSKSQAIAISSVAATLPDLSEHPLILDGCIVLYSDTVKNLGIIYTVLFLGQADSWCLF